MNLDAMQADIVSTERLRTDGFTRALRLMEEHGARMVIPARPELCLLDEYKDIEDPEQPNSMVAPRFDTLPQMPRKICRLTASLCRLILAAPLFITVESHDVRRDWRNSITQLPGVGPYADLMYRGNALRPNMVTSLNSVLRMLERSVLSRDDIPPQVISDLAKASAAWQCPEMAGYLDWDAESKIRVGKMVRDQAERMLEVLTR
jgi:hypothetical protein